MENKGIYIFLGPPFSGKETQTMPLSSRLDIPVFSMGALIREARSSDPAIEEAFQKYTRRGLHVPIKIKFGLLEKEMDKNPGGFILDNFPASLEDLEAFNSYLKENEMEVNKVFHLRISNEEMMRRYKDAPDRGRMDDTPQALETRGNVQYQDRLPVLNFFKEQGKLIEIDGEKSIDDVSDEIRRNL